MSEFKIKKIPLKKVNYKRSFFQKHGFLRGIDIIRRFALYNLLYKPTHIKKWIKINEYNLPLDYKDSLISKGLYIMKSREILETEIIKHNLKKEDVCLDAGANIGYYVFLEAKITNSTIYAFEPDPRNIKLLKKGIIKNGFKNIEVFEKAISNKLGKERLYLSNQTNVSSMVKHEDFNGKIVEVETETIDNFCKNKKIDFIRMDVEGFEYEIFQGMENLIKSKKPLKIMVEFHSNKYSKKRNFPKRLEELKRNGFICKHVVTQEKPLIKIMEKLGYAPKIIVNDSPNLRAMYSNIKIEDVAYLIGKGNFLRAGFFERK